MVKDASVSTISVASASASPHDVETQAAPSRAPRPDSLLGVRHLQTFLLFLCLTVAYTLRVNLSVAIVAMVDKENSDSDVPVYPWNESVKSTILSSFFWGYVLTQVPAGQLAQMFGPKILLVVSLTVASIFTILTPVFAAWGGWPLVCATRVIQGLSQGFIFPSVHTLLAKWAPVEERGRLATYSYAGAQFGTILALPLCGLLASSSVGWPSCFYVFGSLGLLWAVLWFFLGSNSPADHSFISKEERAYIEESLGTTSVNEKRDTPWSSILTSVPMLALIIVHCGQNWGFWTLLTEMPTYMNDVLDFNLKQNGLLSAAPYLCMWILSFIFSWLSDLINKKQLISLAASRKLFNTIAHWGPALALIGVGYSKKEYPYVAVGLLTISVGLNAGTYVGFQVNHIDLSPNFAGTLMGITNGIANILSIVGPLVVGIIVTEQGSVVQWRTVFFIASGIYFVCNLIYIIFGKAEVQPWNGLNFSAKKKSAKTDEKAEAESPKDLEKSSKEKSSTEKSSKEKSDLEKSSKEKSSKEKSSTEKLDVEESSKEKSSKEKSDLEESSKEKSSTEKSDLEESSKEKSSKEKLDLEESSKEKSSPEKSSKEKSSTEKLVEEESSKEKSSKEKSDLEESSKEKL